MDIQAEKVIERYAQELARVQQQLFITQTALEAYQEAEQEAAMPRVPIESDN